MKRPQLLRLQLHLRTQQLPIEQINNTTGTVTYLHHDQQGSTRLLTGSTGTIEGSYTYDAYGNTTGHTGTATTPLGYDGQYTSSDTGLIYLRARVYDPATTQFLSRDPLRNCPRSLQACSRRWRRRYQSRPLASWMRPR
jgi:RHS repeat-associated protein